VKINHELAKPFGTIGIKQAEDAMAYLSGGAFKLWVKLCLNQNGFIASIPSDHQGIDELIQYGYLIELDGKMTFSSSGDAGCVLGDYQFNGLFERYSVADGAYSREAEYIMSQLEKLDMTNEMQVFTDYWKSQFDSLHAEWSDSVKNQLRYDFMKIATRYLHSHFEFQYGDIIKDALKLRYSDEKFRASVYFALQEHETKDIPIGGSKNIALWNDALKDGKFDLSIGCAAQIIAARKVKVEVMR
jgi:hypothetical protein